MEAHMAPPVETVGEYAQQVNHALAEIAPGLRLFLGEKKYEEMRIEFGKYARASHNGRIVSTALPTWQELNGECLHDGSMCA